MDAGLKELSERACKGPWSVSGSRRRHDEASCVIVDAPGCAALFALATGDGEHDLESLDDAKFIVALVNAYRAGRLVERDP